MRHRNLTLSHEFKHIAKYPKFLILFVTFLIAYLLFYGRTYEPLSNLLLETGLVGAFVAGMFFSYGFTAAPATAILLMLGKQQHILAAGLIGGLGALCGDLIIFKFIRFSLANEIKRLSKEKFARYMNRKTPSLLKAYLLPIVAGFIIASPLPDEIGVSMLASSRAISIELFSIISYVLNAGGIIIILAIGSSI